MEGRPVEQVRALWAAYARGGAEAMHALVGDASVQWVPLDGGEHVSVTVQSFEDHGSCVLAHGSMRVFRDGGFVDLQPTWVYFFRGERLVRGAGYPTREAALEAISRSRS